MDSVPKGTFPCLALAGVLAFTIVCQNTFSQKNKYKKHFPRPLLAVCLALFLALAAYSHTANLPSLLSTTVTSVVEKKLEQRAACRAGLEIGDLIRAEDAIMDSSLGRALAANAKKEGRVTMAKLLQGLFEPLAFGAFGSMYAAIPILVLLLSLFSKKWTWHMQSQLETVIPIAMPLTVAAGIMSYCMFFFWIQPSQVSECLRISGHWYTYWVTTYWLFVTLCHLAWHSPSMASAYVVVVAVYQVVGLHVLATTQLYFHDSEEALAGIERACVAVVIETIVFYVLVQHVATTVIDPVHIFIPVPSDPVEHVEAEKENDISEFSDEEDNVNDGAAVVNQVKVVCNYKKSQSTTDGNKNELTVLFGQMVTVIERDGDMVLVKADGLVPAGYIAELPPMDTDDNDKTVNSERQAVVTSLFEAQADTELSVDEGDVLTIIQEAGEDWVHVEVQGWVSAECLAL